MYGPSDKEIDRLRQKTTDLTRHMTSEELSYTLGRYCGPYNQHLAIKKYGHALIQSIVEETLKNKLFEEEVLGLPTNE